MKRIAPLAVAYPPPASPETTSPTGSARSFRRRVLLMAALATLLILGLAAIIYANAMQYRALNRSVHHAHAVEQQLVTVAGEVNRAEAIHQTYLLSGDEDLLASYYALLPTLSRSADKLVSLVADSADQKRRAEQLRTLVLGRKEALAQLMKAYRAGGVPAVSAHLQNREDSLFPKTVHALASTIRSIEEQHVSASNARRERLANITVWLTASCLLACLALLWRATTLAIREQRIRMQSELQIASANADLATLLEQSQLLADQLTRLSDFGEMLQSCRKLSEALAMIGSSMPDLLPGSAGTIQLLNASRNLVETATEWGTPAIGYEAVFPPDDCLGLRRGHAYPPPGGHAAVHCQHLLATPSAAATNPYLCVPLINQGETLGLLHVQPREALNPDVRRLLLTIGEHLALALGNLRMQETLRMQSIRDPLTGLFNRRYLEASLTRELLRAQRSGRPLALLMLDIDHFKRFNDTYGHEAGDHLLVQLSATIKRSIRAEEIACRFGGEEFTVILPETTCDVAQRRAEDIRQAVSAMDVRHQEEPLGTVTVSLGVSCFPQHGIDAGQLMRAADAALYQAKRGGRNRTETAQEA